MIGAPMHPHAAARGYSRPAPDPIVAPAQSSREGSAGIRVRARNARLPSVPTWVRVRRER